MPSKTRKQARKGGKYVFEGSYGCTYRPSIKCRGEDARALGTISKIMDEYEAYKEFHTRKLFERIDPTYDYFLYPMRMCDPEVTSNPENNYNSCRAVPVNIAARGRGLKLVLYKDGGDNLALNLLGSEDYVPFFDSLTNLFDGLVLLKTNNIVHGDIKPPNLVTKKEDDGTFKTCFIDFGLSQKFSYFKRGARNPWNAKYRYWPADVKLLYDDYLNYSNPIDDSVLSDHISTMLTPYYPITFVGRSVRGGFFLSYSYDEYRALQADIQADLDEADSIIEKIDVFGLGRSLFEIYFRLTGHTLDEHGAVKMYRTVNIGDPTKIDAFHENLKTTVSTPLFDLIKSMVNPDPRKRISAEQARDTYARLLPAIRRGFAEFPLVRRLEPIETPATPAAGPPTETRSEPLRPAGLKLRKLVRSKSSSMLPAHSRLHNLMEVVPEAEEPPNTSNNSSGGIPAPPAPNTGAFNIFSPRKPVAATRRAAVANLFEPPPQAKKTGASNLFEPPPQAKKGLKRGVGSRKLSNH